MKKFIGCGTALITPFNKNSSIDYPVVRKLIQRQLNGGIDFLVPLGSTGEAACLNDEEKILLIDIIAEEVNGSVPIVVGVGSNSTSGVLANIKLFKNAPIDGFLVVTPYYNKPTQEGLYRHFVTIAQATNKPIILYNVPGRTAVNLAAETTLKLATIKNIVAIKESSNNLSQIDTIISHAPKGFTVLSGDDGEMLPLAALGAQGLISVASNIIPWEMTKFVNLLLANNFLSARKVHRRLSRLFNSCFLETNPIPVKAAMSIMGLMTNVLRSPLCRATDNTCRQFKETLKELELI
jgi:4-hydroxy-tetrahydrodipicolinate synthase